MCQLFKFMAFAVAVAMSVSIVSCKEDNEFEDNIPDKDLVEIPTEDQMTELCKVPVVVIGSGFSDVSEAFIRRIENRQSELTEDAEVIFFKGEDIYRFSVEQCKIIGKAYQKGAILAIDNPKEKQILDLAMKITAPEFAQGFSGEEHDVPFADLIAYNTPRGKQYILEDIFDDDPITYDYREWSTEGDSESDNVSTEETNSGTEATVQKEFKLTPYTAGLYADEFSKWLNNLDEAAGRCFKANHGSRSSSLDQLAEAQQVTRTYSFKAPSRLETDGFSNTARDIKGHIAPVTVNYFIYGVYSFSKDADYYLIDQEISVCSSPLWRGTGNNEKGFQLLKVYFDAHISADNGKNISRSDGCNILNHSPNTTTGSQTITTTSSISIGGNVGLSPTGPSVTATGGVSWGVNHASTLPDVSVENNVMDNQTLQNNAKWTYNIQYNSIYFPGFLRYPVFGDTPTVGKTTFHTYNSWIWQVDRPKRFNNFKVVVDKFQIYYRGQRFATKKLTKYESIQMDYYLNWETNFKLIAPNRK